MNIAICDDSKEYGEIVANIVDKITKKNNINCKIDLYCSSIKLISALQKFKYDIFFLDMDMPELNGIETGLLIRKNNKEAIIIYLTSFKEYAYESYQVKAKEYLLKPVSEDILENTILDYVKDNNEPIKFLDVKDTDGIMHRIPLNEITHILRKKEDRKIHIYCLDGREIKIVQTLESLEKVLLRNDDIIKSSKSGLINLNNVRSIKKNVIYFSNDVSEEASRRCLSELMNRFKQKSEVII